VFSYKYQYNMFYKYNGAYPTGNASLQKLSCSFLGEEI